MGAPGTPLDDGEKSQVRYYLGYQDLFRDLNTTLESQMTPGGISQPAVEIVRGILADLATIDASLVTSRRRFKASRIGSITLNSDEREMLCTEGRRDVGRLASIFGVRPLRDVFGEAMGGGGLVPLG